MKLVFSPASPYARKCMAVAIETGIVDRIEKVSPDASQPLQGINLTLMALGNGMADCSFLIVHEGRINGERSPTWGERNWNGIRSATEALEKDISQLDGDVHIGHFAIGAALGYLDLRHDEKNWREGRPKLAAWFAEFSKRPAMAQTVPVG